MIFVQHFVGMRHVNAAAGQDAPRQRDEQFQVRADDGMLRRGGGDLFQARQFAARFFERFFGHAGGGNFVAEIAQYRRLVVHLAQFLLDNLQLLAQEIFALRLAYFVFGARLHLLAQLQHFHFALQKGQHRFQFGADRIQFQHGLALFHGHAGHGGDQRDDRARIVHVQDGSRQIVLQIGRKRDDALKLRDNGVAQGFHLDAQFQRFRRGAHLRRQIGPLLGEAFHDDALQAVHEDAHRAVGQPHVMGHARHRPHPKDVIRAAFFDFGIFLRHEANELVATQDLFHQLERAILRDP